jgi:hypothetical protein
LPTEPKVLYRMCIRRLTGPCVFVKTKVSALPPVIERHSAIRIRTRGNHLESLLGESFG